MDNYDFGSAVEKGPLGREVRRLSCERNKLSAIASRLSLEETEKWIKYTAKKVRRERAVFKEKLEVKEIERFLRGEMS